MEFSQNAFAAPSRTLTSLGAGSIAAVTSINTALANGSTATLTPAAGAFRSVTLLGVAAVNVTWSIGLSDGVTLRVGVTGASGAAVIQQVSGNNAFGPGIFNGGTVSGNYSMGGFDLFQ